MAGFGLHLGAYYCQCGFWVRDQGATCSGKGLMVGGDTLVSCGVPVFLLGVGWGVADTLTSTGLDLRLSVWMCPCSMLQPLLTMH